MRYPKSQQVLGYEYTIEVRDDLIETRNALGLFEYKPQIISIQKGLDADTGQRTYLHECYHAVLHRLGIDVLLSAEINELIVDGFANFNVDEKKMMLSLLRQLK